MGHPAGTSATTGSYCWGYQYSYDAWGNLLAQAGWSPTYNGCTETTMGAVTADGNNHISAFSYDASGNALGDGLYSYTWNAESQMKTAGGVTYSYDGDGRRAAKVGSKLYWYGSGGEILAETDAAGNTLNEYVFFGGRRVALVPASGSALYYAEDLLGSSRVIAQSNGTLCYDADFTPFGGEKSYTSTCAQNYKFEGKERDTETQNDNFGAREYSWRFGRWLSADWSSVPAPVPYANLTNPQTLNLYAMVADDPESFADLDGHGGGGCNTDVTCQQPNQHIAGNTNAPVINTKQAAVVAKEGATKAAAVALDKLKSAAKAANDAISKASDFLNDHPLLALALTLGMSAEKDEPALEKTAEDTMSAVETKLESVESKVENKVEKIVGEIEEGGFRVTPNEKSAGQEGNVTITHPSEAGGKLNLRVETHPLEPGGAPVRHANVERVVSGSKNRPVVASKQTYHGVGMRKQFTYTYDEDGNNRISFEYSPEADEKLASSVVNGVPFIYLNRSGMITLARILIKMANGSYSEGFHVHLRKDFNADAPESLVLLLSSGEAKNESA